MLSEGCAGDIRLLSMPCGGVDILAWMYKSLLTPRHRKRLYECAWEERLTRASIAMLFLR